MQFTRATHATFEAEFVDQDGQPLVRADPESYPATVVKDPQGTTIATGVGKNLGDGKYQWNWFVPADAEINTLDSPWSISWFFLTDTGQNKDYQETFDVVDQIEPEPEERAWTYLLRENSSERLFLKLDKIPQSLSLTILDPNNNPMHSVEGISDSEAHGMTITPLQYRKISYLKKDGVYHFFFDTEPLAAGEYLIFWRVQQEIISQPYDVQQLLRVPIMHFWRLNQPLRMLIDKLQKKIGWVQAYSDADIYEYILRGVDMANIVQPTTNWTLGSIPQQGSRGVINAVLLFAAVWGLNAQQILETELQFDHGGQTVQLTYNHDYGGVLGNINELLGKYAESKLHIYRIAQGPGRVGVRPKNWRFTQRVWRVDDWGAATSPYDVSVLMTSCGL